MQIQACSFELECMVAKAETRRAVAGARRRRPAGELGSTRAVGRWSVGPYSVVHDHERAHLSRTSAPLLVDPPPPAHRNSLLCLGCLRPLPLPNETPRLARG
ncbi:hypothetical protein E2562_038992 [Oryza meyeriana var. granulata]|uniref:Uncharacterized protein n=1 Tax=Oryza meyeriana var. granulata TaxID=110450 RepID=A0A6G1EUH5_9ORYZ|nr:hypothetical protein E2562_038992 [Oryza meyeriana var. granulata]